MEMRTARSLGFMLLFVVFAASYVSAQQVHHLEAEFGVTHERLERPSRGRCQGRRFVHDQVGLHHGEGRDQEGWRQTHGRGRPHHWHRDGSRRRRKVRANGHEQRREAPENFRYRARSEWSLQFRTDEEVMTSADTGEPPACYGGRWCRRVPRPSRITNRLA